MQLLIVILTLAIAILPCTGHAQMPGTLDYDTAANKYKYYNGSSWVSVGAPILLTSCGAADKAKIEYDPVLNILRYCNGSVWMTLFGLPTLAVCTQKGVWRYNGTANMLEFCNGLLWILMA